MDNKQLGIDIRTAIKQGDVEKVVALIGADKARLEMMTPFGTWLHVAAHHGQLEIVKRLVALGAGVNALGDLADGGPLEQAASEGHLGIVEYLLSCGAHLDVSKPERNPLFGAIYNGHSAIAKLLIDSGIDIHAKYMGESGKEKNALSFARDYGRTEIVEMLIAKGASISREEPAVSKPTHKEIVDEIIESFNILYGPAQKQALHEILPSEPPILIHVIPAGAKCKHLTLFTTGMSKFAMTTPDDAENFRFAEAYIHLPAQWALDSKALEDPKYFWPIEWLRKVAKYPHLENTWLGGPITILTNNDPTERLAPGLKFTSLLLMAAHSFIDGDGRKIQLYRLMPLYPEERELEIKEGMLALWEAFENSKVPFVVDLNRRNVAK